MSSLPHDNAVVSAVTSVRNQESTIEQTVKSVLALGDAIDEYIILDDASTDGTLAILQKYAALNPVIKLLHNEENVGCVAGFRRLFAESKGNYVLGIAGDDYLLPEGMKKLIRFAKEKPGMGLYFGDIIIDFCDENRQCHSKFNFSTEPRNYSKDEIGKAIRGLAIPSAGMLIDRRHISDPEIYRSDLRWLADWLGNLIIAFRYGAGYVPAETVVWRVYESNYSSKSRIWSEQKKLLLQMMELLRRPEYSDIYRNMLKWRLFNSIGAGMCRLLISTPSCWDRYSLRLFLSCLKRVARDNMAKLIPPRIKRMIRK